MSDYSPWVCEFNDGWRIARVSRVDGAMQYLHCDAGVWGLMVGLREPYVATRFDTRDAAQTALMAYILRT